MKLLRENKRMRAKRAEIADDAEVLLPAELCEILQSGIIVRDDCYFLKVFFDTSPGVSIADFGDRTGLECYVNHTHPDMYVDGADVSLALAFLEEVSKMLSRDFPLQKFLGCVDSDNDGRCCSVRFHCWREDEPQYYVDDLESYEDACAGIWEL